MRKLSFLFVITALLAGCQAEKEKPLFVQYDTFEQLEPLFNRVTDSVYVINFWSTWCKPCIEEMPYFEQLHAELADEKVRVVLVSLDFPDQVESKLIPFLEAKQLASDVALLLDERPNRWIDKVDPEWSGAIPATVIYNAEQRVFHGTSYKNYEELLAMVKPML